MAEDSPPLEHKAVFLSYSREDTEQARRIADALRAFGIEVWFDQNELRGGDSWDAKIRKQIRECALFVPVISASTQTRMEGYFRREWKLGVERTHDMAAGVAFIVPVVIDETLESDATVPDEFMRVQWSRIPHGVPTPEFVSQVKRLLETPAAARRTRAPSSAPGAAIPATAQKSTRFPRWAIGAICAAVAGVFVTALAVRRGAPAPAALSAPPPSEARTAEAAPAISEKSVAVLPFENMSEDKDANAFFADGVQDDILTDLSFIKDLRVMSRTSVMQYRGTTKPIGQIARELGVAFVLEGSVRRAGNKVRVTGQLIRAATDEHVWAKYFDRDITDVFAIQSELSQAIADALQAAISPAEKTLLDRKPTENPAAYDLFVKAREIYEGAGKTKESTDLLVEAVQLDPGFAQAWALIASNHAFIYFNNTDSSPERLEMAKAAIDTAVRLAPEDPFVIEMQGDYYYYAHRDYAKAAEIYERLLAIRPNSTDALGSLALIYRRQGRFKDSIDFFRRTIDLDPRNLRYRSNFGEMLWGLRRYDEAYSNLDRTMAIEGENLELLFDAAVRRYFVDGTTTEADNWFTTFKPKPEERDHFRAIERNWDRTKGDFAAALAIDKEMPFYDGYSIPRVLQSIDAAWDKIGVGDNEGAKADIKAQLGPLDDLLKSQPNNLDVSIYKAFCDAVLGRRDEAMAAADKVVRLLPESLDRIDGPQRSKQRAQILAWTGDKEGALAELARLLKTPFGANVHNEQHDIGWQPISDDPRFKALMTDPSNNAPFN